MSWRRSHRMAQRGVSGEASDVQKRVSNYVSKEHNPDEIFEVSMEVSQNLIRHLLGTFFEISFWSIHIN